MIAERYRNVKRHFIAALDLPAVERAAYVGRVAEDAAMRDEILALLAESESTAGFDIVSAGSAKPFDVPVVSSRDEEPKASIGGYRILGTLGRGGMGTVYLAEQASPRRKVAIKVVRSGMVGAQALARFRLEADILGRLDHEGIAQIYEAGAPVGESPFIAMELIEGIPFNEYVASRGRSAPEILDLLQRIAHAIAHAHQRGIVHRDLKPGNILVTPDGRPKILDFGISRLIDDGRTEYSSTETGAILGTLAYMSPEQANGRSADIDTRTDVYALGVIAYEALTGTIPCDVPRATFTETLIAIRDAVPTPLARLVPGVDPDIAVIVHHALEKEKARRYASASDFAEDIARYLRHEPIVARPPSGAYLAAKFVRRHRAPVGGLFLIFAVLAGGIIATSRARREAERAKTAAERDRDAVTAAKKESDASLEEARAMQRFLESIIGAARGEDRGKNVTVVDAISFADERVKADFAARPRIEAAVRFMLGETRLSLGEIKKAEVDLNEALRIRRSLLDPGDPAITDVRSRLGQLYFARGALAEADRELSECVDVRRNGSPDDRSSLAGDLSALANVRQARGKATEAKAIYEEAIGIYESLYGPNSRDLAGALSAYGVILRELAAAGPAEQALRRSVAMFEAVGLADSLQAATAMLNLAQVLQLLRKEADAEPFFKSAIAIAVKKIGDGHPTTASFRANLANLYVALGRLPEAKAVALVAMTALNALGPEHRRELADVETVLARIAEQEGNTDECIRGLKSAIAHYDASIGKAALQTMRTRFYCARYCAMVQRFDDGYPVSRDLYEVAKKTLDPSELFLAEITMELSGHSIPHEDLERSAALAKEALALVAPKYGDSQPIATLALQTLAYVLKELGRLEEAKVYEARFEAASKD